MKTRLILNVVMAAVLFTSACQQDVHDETASLRAAQLSTESTLTLDKTSGNCIAAAYSIVLESRTLINGNWEWVWSIENLNPGNGNNGTAQDLSNWGIRLGACFNVSSLVGAAYSSNGTDWTEFTPSIQPEPSQNCLSTPVLKFDFGTTGTTKSWYRLTISEEYPVGNGLGYYKSGSRCCLFGFSGIDCEGPVEIVE